MMQIQFQQQQLADHRQGTFAAAAAASAVAAAAVGFSMFALIPDSAAVLSNAAWSVSTDAHGNTMFAGLGSALVETADGARKVVEWGSGACPDASMCSSCNESTSAAMPVLVAALVAMAATVCASILRAGARRDTA